MDRGDEDFTEHREIELALWRTGGYFFDRGRTLPALSSFRRLLRYTADPGMKAACLLSIGQLMERTGRYDDAARYYTLAFPLGSGCDDTWYFLNNNLGYCLNILGRHDEAEAYCRAAIGIDPKRHNAHKNLGLSLLGLVEHAEAASCFIKATTICPTDTRAFRHLEDLIGQNRNLLRECPGLENKIEMCREIMQIAWNSRPV
jgi:tetratricopeptide (TPR) repeat protein